jgi:hypothetical protein
LALSLDGYAILADQIGFASPQIAFAWVVDSQKPAPHARFHLLHQILLI